MSTVIEQLEREWCQIAVDRRAARRLRTVCDAADRAADLGQLELYVRRAAPADADRILVALVGPASGGGKLEARVLLQLLLPGVRRLARQWWVLGDRDEQAAAAVAAVWQRICTYRLDRRPSKVAANILMDAAKELRRAATTKGGPTQELPAICPAPDPQQPAADELVQILDDAVHIGALTIADAQLVAAFRITGQRLADIAAHRGTSVRTVRRRRRAAERALVSTVAAA
jgi:hypothetical protein